MSRIEAITDKNDVASHEPRPIATVMAAVLARYGLTEPPQLSELTADYWSSHSARTEEALAVA